MKRSVFWNYLETLDIETLRAPLRVDRVYKVRYKGRIHILHLEFEIKSSTVMACRLLEYHAYLYRKYRYPVISIIVYPFKTTMAQPPLVEKSGMRELLRFHFFTLPLWELSAEQHFQEWDVPLYALLPTMQGADAKLLNKAIDKMVEYYENDTTKLAEELRWLGIVTRRADFLPLEDKQTIERRLTMYDDLMERDPKMQKLFSERKAQGKAEGIVEGEARGKVEGIAEGKAEGKAEVLQMVVITIVKQRFPPLAEFAQQKIAHVKKPDALDALFKAIIEAPDERMVRALLEVAAA